MLKHFTGTHDHKLDAKGRVSMPTEFRRVLETVGSTGALYIVPQMDDPRAHAAFTVDAYDKLIQRHNEAEYDDDLEMLEMEAILIGSAAQVQVDDAGRIVLNQDLRERIGLSNQVRFVGLASNFEIWEPAARAAFEAELRAARSGPRKRIDRRGLH